MSLLNFYAQFADIMLLRKILKIYAVNNLKQTLNVCMI